MKPDPAAEYFNVIQVELQREVYRVAVSMDLPRPVENDFTVKLRMNRFANELVAMIDHDVYQEDVSATVGYRYASIWEWFRGKLSPVLKFLAIPYKPKLIPVTIPARVLYPYISMPDRRPVVKFAKMPQLGPLMWSEE